MEVLSVFFAILSFDCIIHAAANLRYGLCLEIEFFSRSSMADPSTV